MIISLVTTKGGSGKSTIALNLATSLSKSDIPTMLIDADPQGSINSVFAHRETQSEKIKKQLAVDLAFERNCSESLIKRLDAIRNAGVVVIDTFGYDHPLLWEIVKKSDLVIVPASIGYQDLEVAISVANRAAQVTTTRLLINRFHDGFKMSSYVLNRLEQVNEASPVIKTVILRDRQLYPQAFAAGLGVCEADPESKAAEEISRLSKYVTCNFLNNK